MRSLALRAIIAISEVLSKRVKAFKHIEVISTFDFKTELLGDKSHAY